MRQIQKLTSTAVTEAALDIAGRLQKADPRNPFPHNLAGSAHIQAKRYEKARENFLAALKIKSDYRPAKYNLANMAYRLESPEAAKRHYLAILETEPNQIRAMTALTEIAVRLGNKDDDAKRPSS